MSQVAQFAHLYDVILYEVKVDLRAEFDNRHKYDLGGATSSFDRVVYKLKVRSPSPIEQVRALLDHAERGCHAAQSLRSPVPVSVEMVVNGEPLSAGDPSNEV